MARERLEVKRERCRVEGMVEGEQRFFFQFLEMGRSANWAEAMREEAVGRDVVTEEEVLRSLTELVAFRYEIKALRSRDANPDNSEESPRTGFEVMRGEMLAL
ncbi:hypothetical protein ACLOJK_019947 [Asimina triloba]